MEKTESGNKRSQNGIWGMLCVQQPYGDGIGHYDAPCQWQTTLALIVYAAITSGGEKRKANRNIRTPVSACRLKFVTNYLLTYKTAITVWTTLNGSSDKICNLITR